MQSKFWAYQASLFPLYSSPFHSSSLSFLSFPLPSISLQKPEYIHVSRRMPFLHSKSKLNTLQQNYWEKALVLPHSASVAPCPWGFGVPRWVSVWALLEAGKANRVSAPLNQSAILSTVPPYHLIPLIHSLLKGNKNTTTAVKHSLKVFSTHQITLLWKPKAEAVAEARKFVRWGEADSSWHLHPLTNARSRIPSPSLPYKVLISLQRQDKL